MKLTMKQFFRLVSNYWRSAITIGLGLTFVIGLLWFKLGELPGGISSTEAIAREHMMNKDVTFGSILDNPLYLPYSVALFVFQQFNVTTLGALRSISAFVGLGTVIAFYLLLRQWHTSRMATLGTVLFTTSSWFLHTARYGSTDILFAILIIFVFAGVWLQHSRYRATLLSLLLFCTSMTLYIPGMIWFVALGAVWQHKRILKEFHKVPTWFIVTWLTLGTIFVTPLVWSLIQDPGLIRPLLGLPQTLPSLATIARGLGTLPIQLLARGPNDPAIWLGRLPLLDLFSSVMLIIGLYWYMQRLRLDRTIFMIAVAIIGSLLLAIKGPVNMVFFLPFVYMIITAGMTFMLQQWFTVFPRNPLARNIGTILLSLAVIVTAYYHVTHYFIAWPNTPETQAAYQQKP